MAHLQKHILNNDFLKVIVNEKGAELSSLSTSEREYIWQANPDFWARHAPILFPVVGRLIDHEYFYKNKAYTMHQHGFARDSNFKVIESKTTHMVLELNANDKTKKLFPFDFKLQVTYTLVQSSVRVEYRILNPSEHEDLYFSIGAHPAFNCPFESEHHRNEYQLVFDRALEPESETIVEGFRVSETTKVFEHKGKLMVNDSIFDNDALIFNPNPFSKVSFIHEPSQKEYLSVVFKNFPYLGIWSSGKEAPFLCIEPWHGITDHKKHTKELSQKEGIIRLLPGKTFSCEFTIEVR